MPNQPLVSVVMPAYKTDYLAETLDSLLQQSYQNLELIVCDDSTTDAVREIVEAKAKQAQFPVLYSKNEKRLREFGSTQKAAELAKGEYIKILHDDDILLPDCISGLVSALEHNPSATLATSKRQRIDEQGQRLDDEIYTANPFPGDVLVRGSDLVSFLGDNTINFIGEPSCTLCRKESLLAFSERYSHLNGKSIARVGDLAFYVKLLRQGDLVYLADPLTQIRVSRQQFSQKGREQPDIGEKSHADFRQAIRDLGWYRDEAANNNIVQVARIGTQGQLLSFKPFNLLEAMLRAGGFTRGSEASVSRWLAGRTLTAVQNKQLADWQQQAADVALAVLILGQNADSEVAKQTSASLVQHRPNGMQLHTMVVMTSVVDWIQALNKSLQTLDSDWIVIVREGIELTASGLLMAQIELAQQPQLAAISFDEIYRMEDGSVGAAFRPVGNLDYLLSFPAGMSRHWLFNRKALLEIGGFNTKLPEAFELDAILRIINHYGLEGIGHVAEPLFITKAPELINIDEERVVIENHLRQRGYTAAEVQAPMPGRYRVWYGHVEAPIVSIVIPTRNQLSMVQRCVESILEKTRYQNYEILIVDNDSDEQEAVRWLNGIERIGGDKVRVLRYPHPFNFSAMNNFAASQSVGDYLLLLNNDTAVIDEHWLDAMLNHGQRPEVGVVGAKLLFPNGTIQHAGVILGLNGPAEHPFLGEAMDAPGYMQRLQVDQNYSAVTAACMLVRKEVYFAAGGMDEEKFKVSYNDVDFCLKVRELGYLNVWTPHAVLLHEGSVSQKNEDTAEERAKHKRFTAEQDAMYDKWLPQLARDPAYNPNFSLAMPGGFKLADSQISWRPLDSIRPAPVALVHPADLAGCGHYRVMQPFLSMKEAGLLDGAISIGLMHVTDLERYNPDCIVLQRQIGDERLHAMQRMKRFSQAFKVYELDDYLPNLPLKSVHRKDMPKDILKSLRRGLSFVDRFVVSTPALAEAFAGLHGEIVVRENRLPLGWWGGLQTERRKGKKPRVGWAGGSSHTGDLELIADVVRDLADEVEWVFFGMCPEALKPYVHEFHGGVPIEQYPAKLASLNLDLGLAPLEHNLFNECKSNLRQLEYGACGIPIICTDIRPYREGQQAGLPVTLVKNRYKDWVDAIRMHINDLDATARMGDELQAKVLADWMLQGEHLIKWRDAWVGR